MAIEGSKIMWLLELAIKALTLDAEWYLALGLFIGAVIAKVVLS